MNKKNKIKKEKEIFYKITQDEFVKHCNKEIEKIYSNIHLFNLDISKDFGFPIYDTKIFDLLNKIKDVRDAYIKEFYLVEIKKWNIG